MANYAEGVNPEILKWARERAGYTLDDIARAFKRGTDEISKWEQGDLIPTYNQLERLAYTYYRRPLALFFFPSPPEEVEPEEEFRTLPEFEIANLIPNTRHAIREAQGMQVALRELTNGENPSERQVFKEVIIHPNDNVSEVTRLLRSYLGVSVSDQSEWSDSRIALSNWRRIVQDVGIFVFKRSFRQDDVSGFCLVDPEFPIIYLNNGTAKTRQIFTIFHELAHILFQASGITKIDDSYIRTLTGEARDIEIFSNAFAAEFLVPSDDFESRLDTRRSPEEISSQLSDFYNVSREVILRKLLDRGMVDQNYYEAMAAQWLEEFQAVRRSSRGGYYYATQAAYLGDRYMNLAFSRYYEGKVSLEDLAGYLNIKVKSIEGLERQMMRRASAL